MCVCSSVYVQSRIERSNEVQSVISKEQRKRRKRKRRRKKINKLKLWPKASKVAIAPVSVIIMNSTAPVECLLGLASARNDASKQKEGGTLKNKMYNAHTHTHKPGQFIGEVLRTWKSCCM